MESMKMTTAWWIDEIQHSVGKFINLETFDGASREGRLSGVRLEDVEFNGTVAAVLKDLELNGDPTDIVPLDRIKSISIQE